MPNVPAEPWNDILPGHNIARSSFVATTLPALVRELKDHEKALTELDDRLQDSIDALPQAIQEVHLQNPGRKYDVLDTLKETVTNSELVREKVDTFNTRVDEALKKSMVFNDLIRRQRDYKEDLLPPEMFQNAGTVVSHLRRARRLGRSLLGPDAEELAKFAKLQKLKFTAAAAPDPLIAQCMGMMLNPTT
eukprot:CAMPEP_0172741872 /NCGR_PEP_ID=MMETSP1074-20121228/128210_1 /TAXON_ID=2916 /ORGANISM="Ceratium fusus, Strain PA161109" /LENGTH=190 /DNA_ID=CAMNT_0013572279 /DNA_START=53 /DNA_END=621 /DNA_ORIENTATION=-